MSADENASMLSKPASAFTCEAGPAFTIACEGHRLLAGNFAGRSIVFGENG